MDAAELKSQFWHSVSHGCRRRALAACVGFIPSLARMTPTPPNSLKSRSFRIGVVLLVCLSLGLHRGVVQGIAWTQMLVRYTSETTLLEAVEMTFDGLHPCPLCEAARKDAGAGQKQPQQSSQAAKKLHAVLTVVPRLIAPSSDDCSFAMCHQSLMRRYQTPETPPPRRGQA